MPTFTRRADIAWIEHKQTEELVRSSPFHLLQECGLESVASTYLGYKRGTLERTGLLNRPQLNVHRFFTTIQIDRAKRG